MVQRHREKQWHDEKCNTNNKYIFCLEVHADGLWDPDSLTSQNIIVCAANSWVMVVCRINMALVSLGVDLINKKMCPPS
jgi:hypothetical protein